MSKFTMASLKSWIRSNKYNLYVKQHSHFDGMTDGIELTKDSTWTKVESLDFDEPYTFGIKGAWFTRKDNNLEVFRDGEKIVAIKVYNCCGYFTLKSKTI